MTAYDLFESRGYSAVTIADIAKAAGVGRRTFFRHFRQKESLFFDTETFESFVTDFQGRLSATDDPVRSLLECYRESRHFPLDEDDQLARRRRRLRAQVRGDADFEAYYTTFLDRTERALINTIQEWQVAAVARGVEMRRYTSYLVPGVWRMLSVHHVDSGEDHHYRPDLDDFVAEAIEALAGAASWRDRNHLGTGSA
ncbi:MAG: helix-turn-helix domain-containing protein [Propionibacteriaceae bacterium]|nr:helix-turn-helix domain-containing protein [Propionibacteriaceae bacterium]